MSGGDIQGIDRLFASGSLVRMPRPRFNWRKMTIALLLTGVIVVAVGRQYGYLPIDLGSWP